MRQKQLHLLLAGLAVLLVLPAGLQAQDDANWEMTIRNHTPDKGPVFEKNGLTYEQAYNAIPFNRTEYDANPSYRHDSAMELLFNELRPTTIIRSQSSRASKYPSFNRPDYLWQRWNFNYYGYPRGYYRSVY